MQLVLTRGVARLGVAAGATGFSAVLLDRAVLRRVAQIAPALLVLLRFAQGFAVGGEWGGGVLTKPMTVGEAHALIASLLKVSYPVLKWVVVGASKERM